jgi:hypothetical protein
VQAQGFTVIQAGYKESGNETKGEGIKNRVQSKPVEKVSSKITFKWHCSFLLQVGYGTMRKDSPFLLLGGKVQFYTIPGSGETAHFSLLMAWMKMCHLGGSN